MPSARSSTPEARTRRLAPFFFFVLALVLGQNRLVLAATITVTRLADDATLDGQVTLREAMEAANLDTSVDGSATGNGADRIVFATGPGTITLNGTPLPTVVDDLTVAGLGAAELIIDGADQTRIFAVAAGVTAHISGLCLTRGRSTGNGAAIWNQGTLLLSNSDVSASATTVNGGGAYNTGVLVVSHSRFAGNSALNGGGIYNAGTATLAHSTFSGNVTGGIAPFAGGGGGILNVGTLTVLASTFWANTAANGGAIVNTTGGNLTVNNSTLSANEAWRSGGGLTTFSSRSIIVNSTFTANRSNTNDDGFGSGGGIDIGPSSTLTIHNSIVARNFNGTGASASDVEGSLQASSSFNLVGTSAGLGGIVHGTNGNLVGTPTSPINPLLGPLSHHGGLTLTRPLLSGSPAIDGGDNGLCPPSDQRGFPRPRDGDDDGNAICDMGAFEGDRAFPLRRRLGRRR